MIFYFAPQYSRRQTDSVTKRAGLRECFATGFGSGRCI
jgi:hypothetical protein